MIEKSVARKSKDQRVRYTGQNRPWLSRDLRLTGAVAEYANSAQVSYTDNLGGRDTAWVGLSALEFVNNDFIDAIDQLKAKLDLAKAEVTRLETAIKTLEEL